MIALAAGTSASVNTVSDSAGPAGSWLKGSIGYQSGANSRVEIWYRLNAPSVTTVTATLSASKAMSLNVLEWSGLTTLDKSAGSTSGTSSTTVMTPLLTTTNANDLVIGAMNYPAAATSTLTAASFTSLPDPPANSSVHQRAAYVVASTVGSFQASWTLSIASGGHGTAIIAFKVSTAAPDTTPPTTPVLAPSSTDPSVFVSGSMVFYRSSVASTTGFTVGATTTDAESPVSVQFPTVFVSGDGGAVQTSSPFSRTYGWASGASASGAKTVTATSSGGSSSASFTVAPDSTAPVSSITCSPGPCGGATGTQSVTLSATDSSGSGAKEIHFTTNGTTPTLGSPVYTSPLSVTATTTVKFFAVDNVGNTEGVQTQTITITSGGGGGAGLVGQTTNLSSSASTLATSLSPASTSGNTLVAIIVFAAGSSASVSSVSDSGGAWAKGPVGFLTGINSRVEIWYRLGAPAVSSVTVTLSSAKAVAVNISEWSGVTGFERSSSGNGSSSTTITTPSLTTTNAQDLVIAATNFPGGAISTLTSGSFTALRDFNSGSGVHGRAAYVITSSTGSFQGSWSLSTSSGGHGTAIIAFKAS